MIISHKHQFIYLHMGRTGGRSLTAALAPHCGPKDVITWTGPEIPAQNAAGIERHASATQVRQVVGEKIWQRYFIFTFERNPWDKVLSRYWAYAGRTKKRYKEIYTWMAGHKLGFENWLRLKVVTGTLFRRGQIKVPRHYDYYTQDDRLCVDFIGRFESRTEHFRQLSGKLGIKIRPDIHIGKHTRKDRRSYTHFYRPWMRTTIEQVFAKDLALLGYRYGEQPPTEPIVGRGKPAAP